MILTRYFAFIAVILTAQFSSAQIDSTAKSLRNIPTKYLNEIDKKIERYSTRVTRKTEKTLTRLSRWETKIHGMLQKLSPETAERLFDNNQPTFTSLLRKIENGQVITLRYKAQYDQYRDDVTTSLEYLANQKDRLDSGLVKKVEATRNRMDQLINDEDDNEALQQFIKERRKELIEQAIQHIGKSKYLTKIKKEAYYYAESLKNYKELFSDKKKAEETVTNILKKIPAFQQFMRSNSELASLFGQPGDVANASDIAGLQTRASIQNLIQDRIAAGGQNAREVFNQNMQEAQVALNNLKDRMLSSIPATEGENSLPDFKPNMQRSKTILQRLEYAFNLQFGKSNNLFPATTNIAATVGYKINDKSVTGFGVSYKLGMGTIQRIRLTHEGIGLRSFIDWKLKKELFITGGYELNYNTQFKNISLLTNPDALQQSALIGVTKKIAIKTKWVKSTNIQLLYDFLSREHVPVSQPVLFRIGYGIK